MGYAISDPIKTLALETFIPRSKDCLSNEQCAMFADRRKA